MQDSICKVVPASPIPAARTFNKIVRPTTGQVNRLAIAQAQHGARAETPPPAIPDITCRMALAFQTSVRRMWSNLASLETVLVRTPAMARVRLGARVETSPVATVATAYKMAIVFRPGAHPSPLNPAMLTTALALNLVALPVTHGALAEISRVAIQDSIYKMERVSPISAHQIPSRVAHHRMVGAQVQKPATAQALYGVSAETSPPARPAPICKMAPVFSILALQMRHLCAVINMVRETKFAMPVAVLGAVAETIDNAMGITICKVVPAWPTFAHPLPKELVRQVAAQVRKAVPAREPPGDRVSCLAVAPVLICKMARASPTFAHPTPKRIAQQEPARARKPATVRDPHGVRA